MELRHLRYFVAVAEERHFGRAAARLRMAQPPLSRQIQALEAELGFVLFERDRRQVELTPAGKTLLEHTRGIFEAVDLAVHEARRASLGESGRIVVAYPSTFAYSGLPELVRAYRAKFPGVELVLRELSPQQQLDALRDHRADVGFIRAPVDEPGLSTELVRSEPLVAALPTGHPLAARTSIPLALLAKEPFVLFPRVRGPAYFDHLIGLCREAGFTPRIVQEAPQLDIVSLVAAGLGVSILPSSIRKFRRSGIVLRPIVGGPRTELLVVWSARNRSAVLGEFLDVLRRQRPR
ncbi:MAG TPA: LysR family transcriptional regulator [Labilithrix sp.]|nr:LysR family transcriptional regulator [Labilithrix sp.]